MELKEFTEQLNAASTELKNAQSKMAEEIKANGAASQEAKALAEKAEANFTELKSMFEKVDEQLKEMQVKQSRHGQGGRELKSLGAAFTSSDVYKSMESSGRGSNQPMSMDKKDISNLAASAGALVRPDRDGRVFQDPNRPMRIRDLIPTVPTASNAVEFMRELAFTNNAGPQGTTAGIGSGEFVAKAQSELTYELVTKPVRTIAHWMAASRQVLSDAPMLQNLIDNRLTYGLDLESDDQLLNGDGTGQNLDGILQDAAINDAGELPSGTAAADIPSAMIDHIRKAIRIEQQAEYYNMTGLVLNPVDWEILETAKATDGHYLMVSMPTGRATETVWRVPVIVTNAMPASTFLIGDWNMGAVIYDREDVSVRVSESHADYFVKNGVAVLAEERFTLAIPLPLAFCKGSFAVAA
ncbi:major capsid protein [Alteromonas phage PB15]|nr:major capsid protein [Alteromonas phage PB15]